MKGDWLSVKEKAGRQVAERWRGGSMPVVRERGGWWLLCGWKQGWSAQGRIRGRGGKRRKKRKGRAAAAAGRCWGGAGGVVRGRGEEWWYWWLSWAAAAHKRRKEEKSGAEKEEKQREKKQGKVNKRDGREEGMSATVEKFPD